MRRSVILTVVSMAVLGAFAGVAAAQPGPAPEPAAAVHPEVWPVVTSRLPADPAVEKAVEAVLAMMSVEQKVGQVIQAGIQHVTPADVRDYHLGSVLNGGGVQPFEKERASAADWLALADAFWEASMDVPDGLPPVPVIWGTDAVHGHNNVIGATVFPHNIGLGATRNPELIRRIGRVTATEMAVTGIEWAFAPAVAVVRDDRWGRTYESFSEDPEVVRACASAMVEGLQGTPGEGVFLAGNRVVATAKHFLGDGGTEGGRDQGDNLATEIELRDLHAAGYVAALEAGVQTVMASFSSWHGQKLHASRELLTDVLKQRMGFDGFVVGDWNAHGQVPGCSDSSCAAAFNAGIDMFMVPEAWRALYESTLAQVRSGEIPMARLDDAVRRILRVKIRAGMFGAGRPSGRPYAGETELLGSAEHRAVARQAVRESLVLLKNNGGLLPLARRQRVLVAGDGADNIPKQCGGWTVTWQGDGSTNEDFPGATSIWDGIRAAVEAGGGSATLSIDGSFEGPPPEVAIVVFGEEPYAEYQGDREHLAYSFTRPGDLELLRRLGQAGIPVVSVFLSGRPLWVNPELNASDAFVAAWLPGTEGGGVADVIFRAADGSVNHDVTGRLSFSWPRTAVQTPLNRGDAGYDPLFSFGFGLRCSDRWDLRPLPEESGVSGAGPAPAAFFRRGPVVPWRLYLGDAADPAVAVTGARTTTRGTEALVISEVDRDVQQDARAARWSGERPAFVYLYTKGAVDLSRETGEGLRLAFDVLVETPPQGEVELSMECGDNCAGRVDLTAALTRLPAGEWRTVAVPLACFASAGADMSRIVVPFGIASDGALALRFSEVRLEPPAEDELRCPE